MNESQRRALAAAAPAGTPPPDGNGPRHTASTAQARPMTEWQRLMAAAGGMPPVPPSPGEHGVYVFIELI